MRVGMQLLDRGSSDHITDARSVSTGCRYHSARSTRSVCWPTKSWMVWYRDIWDHLSVSPTCLADGLCVLQSPIVWQYQLLNCLRSAAERCPFPVLKRGTNYRKKSPLRHFCLPSNVASRHSYSENHSRTLLLIDTLVDLVVILYYLGHSKNSTCLFHVERRWVTSVPWWMSRSHCLPCQSIFYWVFTLHCLLVPCIAHIRGVPISNI